MSISRRSTLCLRTIVLLYLTVLLLAPVVVVFGRTLQHGLGPAWNWISTPAAISALWLTLLVAAIAVWSAFLALWSRRRSRSAVFAYASLSVTLYPWYIVWGLPYALGRPAILRALIVAFPFLDALATDPFTDASYPTLAVIAIAAAAFVRLRASSHSRPVRSDRNGGT